MNTVADIPSVLLADDDTIFCTALSRALRARGYDVHVAHDAGTAMSLVEAVLPRWVVTDLRLPDMSGLRLVQRLKEVAPGSSVVVLTAFGSIATAIEAIKLGATHYLTKPTNADQIVASFDKTVADVSVAEAAQPLSVDRLEWEHIQTVLTGFDGNISATARALNMHRRTLQRKLGKHPPRL